MAPLRGILPDDRRDVGEAPWVDPTASPQGHPVSGEPDSPFESTTARSAKPRLRPDDKLEQRCKWCDEPFRPRRGSGGSKQLFCSDECRKISNRERQRTRRRSPYAGPAVPPATEQPSQDQTLLREPTVAALSPWETRVLNIAGCDRTEFVLALKEGETAGTRSETWPPEVQALMEMSVNRWVKGNEQKHAIRAVTVAAPKYGGTQ
jgi:hypothetical protein